MNLDFDLIILGKVVRARLTDFSLGGVGVFVRNISSLDSPFVDIRIEDIDLEAKGKAVWIKNMSYGVRLGIHSLGPLKGKLSRYRISDVFLGIQRTGKTGTLRIDSSHVTTEIYFDGGSPIFPATAQEHNLADSGSGAGKLLVDLFNLEHGSFIFKDEPLPEDRKIKFGLNIENLIYRGIKTICNGDKIRSNCPPQNSVLYPSIDTENLFQGVDLDENDKRIFSLFDGKNTIKDIISLSPLAEIETLKTVYAFYTVRIIEVLKGRVPDASTADDETPSRVEPLIDPAVLDKIEKLYRDYKSLGYYGVLDIGRKASVEEIKRAYHKMAKEFHPDRYLHFQSEPLKQKLNTIFAYVNEAYKTLTNPKNRMQTATVSKETPKRKDDNKYSARMRFSEGVGLFDRSQYEEALALFAQALYLDDSVAEYHYYYGLVLLKKKEIKPAEDFIKKAIQLDPYNSNYITGLGYLYMRLGFSARARNTFERALKYNPNDDLAKEGIKKATTRNAQGQEKGDNLR